MAMKRLHVHIVRGLTHPLNTRIRLTHAAKPTVSLPTVSMTNIALHSLIDTSIECNDVNRFLLLAII